MDPDLGNARGAGGRAGWIRMLEHPGSSCFTLQHIPAGVRWKQAPLFVGKSHPGGAQGSTTRGGWHRLGGLKRCDLAGIIPALAAFPAGKGCSLSLSQELLRWFKSGTPVTPHLLLANQGRAKPRIQESPGSSSVPTEPRRDLGMAHGWISKAWDGPARPPRAGCARAAAAA